MPFINKRCLCLQVLKTEKCQTVCPPPQATAEMQGSDNPLIHINGRWWQR